MNKANVLRAAHSPFFASVVSGVAWPAIGHDASAHLQSLLFQLENTQWLSPDAVWQRQLCQLKLLLRHAAETVPHYSEALRGMDIDRLEWPVFRSLPVLKRQALQENFTALCCARVPPSHGAVTEGRTSGSTGMPVCFLQTAATQHFWNALTLREHLWQGRDFAGKLAAIRVKVEEGHWPDWGAPAAHVFKTGSGATLNARTDVETQLDWLVRENPDYLITHASNLAALAELTLRRGSRLPNLRQARTYSEALRPEMRDLVRRAWDVEVADVYSCEEAGYIALQCPRHEHYHVQSENLLVEVLDDDGKPCGPGETGRVVITTLHNFAMPLIRYELGDYAEVGEPCDCGRGLPVLTRILGRLRNMIVLPNGRRHWPSFPSALWHSVADIKQFRVTQISTGSLEVRYVMDRALTPTEQKQLEEALAARLGHAFDVAWNKVDAIERSPNAKYEDFVSLLPMTK